jgi:ABC-type ATPase involved in cell division
MAPQRLIPLAALVLLLAHGTVGWGAPAKVAALSELRVDELVDGGTAVLAATHDPRFVAAAADRVVRLDDGWIVEG